MDYFKEEYALAKWKRKNYGVENATLNGLVKMTQTDSKEFDGQGLAYKEALRIVMIQLKDDSLAFAQRVREYLK